MKTFIVTDKDVVNEKDLGANTTARASTMPADYKGVGTPPTKNRSAARRLHHRSSLNRRRAPVRAAPAFSFAPPPGAIGFVEVAAPLLLIVSTAFA